MIGLKIIFAATDCVKLSILSILEVLFRKHRRDFNDEL